MGRPLTSFAKNKNFRPGITRRIDLQHHTVFGECSRLRSTSKRERVFIVGFRSDLGIRWSFSNPTHSLAALCWSQRGGGEHWKRHGITHPKAPVANVEEPTDGLLPWRTVRDALLGLPEPTKKGSKRYLNHELKDGARIYPGHTESVLDMPSKTLKAGAHGVPGGENMLIEDSGQPRYYSIREAARVQAFPDGYKLNGAWSEAMRQLGNAVPVRLAQTVTSSIAEALIVNEMHYIRTSLKTKGKRSYHHESRGLSAQVLLKC